jgi:DNA-binding NtrC family response regulator
MKNVGESVMKKSILTVADEPHLLSALKSFFMPERYQLFTAENNKEPLKKYLNLSHTSSHLTTASHRLTRQNYKSTQFLTEYPRPIT